MKKLFSLIAVLAIVACMAQPVMAANSAAYATNNDKEISTYVLTNASLTGTLVSTSTIIPGKHRILGYELSPSVSGAGTVTVSLYDVGTVAAATGSGTGLFAESVTTTTASVDRVFIYPKTLDNGLVVLQGAGTTVTIFYEKYSN